MHFGRLNPKPEINYPFNYGLNVQNYEISECVRHFGYALEDAIIDYIRANFARKDESSGIDESGNETELPYTVQEISP